MKVWIAWHVEKYETPDFLGAYSSREKAEAKAREEATLHVWTFLDTSPVYPGPWPSSEIHEATWVSEYEVE